MLVSCSMPCRVGRWPSAAFGSLGVGNTCRFHDPLSCLQKRSRRLFLSDFLSACDEALTDHQTGVAIGIPAHVACLAQHKRRARGIPLGGLPVLVADHEPMTLGTFSTGVAGIDATSDDRLRPCLVFGVPEDASLHPESAFAIATAAISALLWLETAQMFKRQDGGPMRAGKLDNAGADLMGQILVSLLDLAPEGDIVLLSCGKDTGFAAISCNPSQLALPKAGYRSSTPNKLGGEDRTFNRLDGADGDVLPKVEINGTDFCLAIAPHLLGYLRRAAQ